MIEIKAGLIALVLDVIVEVGRRLFKKRRKPRKRKEVKNEASQDGQA